MGAIYIKWIAHRAVEELIELLCGQGFKYRSASKFVRPDTVVTLTHRLRPDARRKTQEFVLTIGKPNFRGRAFVKSCLQAGEPFPVKKVQVRRWGKAEK